MLHGTYHVDGLCREVHSLGTNLVQPIYRREQFTNGKLMSSSGPQDVCGFATTPE